MSHAAAHEAFRTHLLSCLKEGGTPTLHCFHSDQDCVDEPEAQLGDLERVSALHPMLRTLVLAVADVYAHRMSALAALRNEELRVRQETSLRFARVFSDIRESYDDTLRQCAETVRQRTEAQFQRANAEALERLLGPLATASLEARLLQYVTERAIQIPSAMHLPRLLDLSRLPEPLPWARLEARMAEWSAQKQRASLVARAASSTMSGVQLSQSLLEAKKAQQVPPTPARTSAGWSEAIAPRVDMSSTYESQGYDAKSAREAAVLYARLRQCLDSLQESVTSLGSALRMRAVQGAGVYLSRIEAAEASALALLSKKKDEMVQASQLGEKVLNQELREATSSNEYTWRAVQRAVQAVFTSYESGIEKSMRNIAAAHAQSMAEKTHFLRSDGQSGGQKK